MGPKDQPEPLGLIAGWGNYPILIAQKAHEMGIPVICLGIRGMAKRADFDPYVHKYYWTRAAALHRPIYCFKKEKIRRYVMAGKVHKKIMFSRFRFLTLLPDLRMIRFWYSRRLNNADDTLTLGIAKEFEKEGLHLESALQICPELLVDPGILTEGGLDPKYQDDIAFGWQLARELGRLDIGQSVMVRERAVLALEAIEGTDEAIRRAGQLCHHKKFVVVKIAKPNQDMRIDVPTIGPSTIQTMQQSGGKILAIEAKKTIFIDQEETVRLANRAGITIVALHDAEVMQWYENLVASLAKAS